jgi:hypothetical protein
MIHKTANVVVIVVLVQLVRFWRLQLHQCTVAETSKARVRGPSVLDKGLWGVLLSDERCLSLSYEEDHCELMQEGNVYHRPDDFFFPSCLEV